jgi:hypothetical protein
MQKKRLVFDLEFVSEDWEDFDEITQKDLLKHAPDKKEDPKGYAKELAEVQDKLVFSPLTGYIVAIGVYDIDSGKGAVYFQDPMQKNGDTEIDNIKYVPMTEEEMLVKFWAICETADEFISFFGRRSDVPYLNIRSAIHGIRPSKDLITNRYNSSKYPGAVHYDLAELLSFYGAAMYRGSLHRWCRAFGIESPKSELSGDKVGEYYRAGKTLEIAKYNAQDLLSTAKLFHKWDQYLRERV